MTAHQQPGAVLCDLDGVIWLAHQPITGSVEAIARMRRVLDSYGAFREGRRKRGKP